MTKGRYTRTDIGKKSDNVYINFTDAFSDLENDIRESVTDAVQEGWRELVTGTPVDTGFARAQWEITDSGGLPEVRQKTRGPHPSANEVVDKGKTKIEKLYDSDGMTISNTASYIVPLEQGHSSKNQYWIRSASKRMTSRIGAFKGAAARKRKK